MEISDEDLVRKSEGLTFVPHCDCGDGAWIWHHKLLFGQLARETENKSINEELRSILAAGQQNSTETAGQTERTFTFFTLAQTGRLSLQPLWTEALQSGKKSNRTLSEYYEHYGGGGGGDKGVWKGGG